MELFSYFYNVILLYYYNNSMNACEKVKSNLAISSIGNRNYIMNEIQKKQNYKTTLQEDEYNLQMEQYIKDIITIQNQYPNKNFYKIVKDYIQNI